MKEGLQVVIPMSGTGERFKKAGYTLPKPLILAGGKPIIRHLIERFPANSRFVFICNEDHLKTTNLRAVLEEAAPRCTITSIAPHKLGPVHAVLEASSKIDDSLPTIVNYCDFSFTWDPQHFMDWIATSKVDGAVVCYRGFHPHYFGSTNYAFCRTDSDSRVLEVREKQNFTNDRTQEFASSGTYFFASGSLVKKYFSRTKQQGPAYNGEYYVSLVYNHLIADKLTVKVYEIDQFCQWGTPEDLEDWNYWHRAFDPKAASHPFPQAAKPTPGILLMPMAGLGSRFSDKFPPKPLIPVRGEPMFRQAANSFPNFSHRVFVLRKEIEKNVRPLLEKQDHLVVLEKPTDGQATTCAAARSVLDQLPDDLPIWISSCDHGLSLTPRTMEDVQGSGMEVGIVGTRHFPGARRTPKAFAYIEAPEHLAKVRAVSVKVPLSDKPQNDWILVGTFYFRQKKLFVSLLEQLLAKPILTNNERYLDSIINVAVEKGHDTRLIESVAYYCWGTPDALNEYRYWHRYFNGVNA